MDDTNDIIYNSSQELRLSSQTLEFNDDYQPSTQEIISIHTQEASNASDFLDNLRASQLSVSDESDQINESQITTQNRELTDFSIDSFNDIQQTTEKKRRGRKRKVRTAEEMEVHLKEKKEKNRLAAQRLRQKKGTEVAKYDQEVVQLEANVRAKKQFAELIESNVNQLRNKIKIMFGMKSSLDIKLESSQNTSSSKDQENGDQNRSKKQYTKLETKDVPNHLFCVSR